MEGSLYKIHKESKHHTGIMKCLDLLCQLSKIKCMFLHCKHMDKIDSKQPKYYAGAKAMSLARFWLVPLTAS